MQKPETSGSFRRRAFLSGAAAVAAATIVRPSALRGSQANSQIRLGMLGCGGRGMWIAPRFLDNGPYTFVACADYYQHRADKFGEAFGVEPAHRYTTLSSYKRLLEDDIDAIVIETPPYFHPEQAAASVDAGKHVFLAKPVAIDVPGCRSIAASGKKATENKLVYLVDFQTRNNPYYRETAKRVHEGQIGRLVTGTAEYHCSGGAFAPAIDPEERLAPGRWYCTKEISGDFIIEQNIHTLDVASWFIDADPIKAYGAGGKGKVRDYGNIWDHFNCIFHFPGDFVLSFAGHQVIPGSDNQIPCVIYGSDGTADTNYFSHAEIRGKTPYEGGRFKDLFHTGAVNNIKDFYYFITQGHFANETVAPSVRSNLLSILGRDAAYQGGELTWKQMMDKGKRLEPDLRGLKS